MNKNIAICCVCYNRLDSLNRLLTSINNAYYDERVDLVISIDKSKTDVVEKFADSFKWDFGKKTIIKHSQNLGLRKHILSCGNLLEKYDAIIILEDDIKVSPSFYYYARQCVNKFYNDESIAGISLYSWGVNSHNFFPFTPISSNSDVYLMQLAQSWGQIWMKHQWKEFINWYNSPDSEFVNTEHLPRSICYWPESSWLKYHIKYCIEKNKYFVYPYVSLSTNCADVGTHNHSKTNTIFQVPLLKAEKREFVLAPEIKYDAFFENEAIYEKLGMSKELLCIDLYGCKGNKGKKRYWLSARKMDYKVINSFSLSYKPFDANILDECHGESIFLYDTFYKRHTKRLFSGNIRIVSFLFNYMSTYEQIKTIVKYLINYKQF